jgi:hypothetical protein
MNRDDNELLRELWSALGWKWAADNRTPAEIWAATLRVLSLYDIRFPAGGP